MQGHTRKRHSNLTNHSCAHQCLGTRMLHPNATKGTHMLYSVHGCTFTTIKAFVAHKAHPGAHIRRRNERDVHCYRTIWRGVVWNDLAHVCIIHFRSTCLIGTKQNSQKQPLLLYDRLSAYTSLVRCMPAKHAHACAKTPRRLCVHRC
jgi:hypothetical protein